MTETKKVQPTPKAPVEGRLPYPPNALGAPKKDFDKTFRLSTAVKRAYKID